MLCVGLHCYYVEGKGNNRDNKKKTKQSCVSSFVYKAVKSLSMKSECSNFTGSGSTSLLRDCRSPATYFHSKSSVSAGVQCKCCLQTHTCTPSCPSSKPSAGWPSAFSLTLCLSTDISWRCTELGARVPAVNSPLPWKRQKQGPKSMLRLETVNVSMNPAEAVDAGSVFKQ